MRLTEARTLARVLIVSAAFAAAFTPTVAVPGEDSHVGYGIEGDEVVFVFDHADYESVSRGDTGRRIAMEQVMPQGSAVVAVAGEFNAWSRDDWVMTCISPGVYELRRPLSDFSQRGSWPFKFVIDTGLWVEPPASATNVVPTGLGNDSYNLLLVISESGADATPPGAPPAGEEVPPAPIESPLLERLALPEEALGGACAVKSIESAVGATPIPVASNPMITGDRRVVGFVSVFVMPPTPEEEASWEAEALNQSPGDFLKRVEELMEQRTANVRAALVAIYESAPSRAETGIFALEFIEPLTVERQKQLSLEGPGGSVLVSEHVAAAVWTDAAERGCFDAVLDHVRSMLGE